MPLSSCSDRDMKSDPFTMGELIEILSEFPKDREIRFSGMNGELLFNKFKTRDKNVEFMELYDPGTMEQMEASANYRRKLEQNR